MQATHQATSVDLRRLNSHVYVASNDGARCNLDPASPSVVVIFGWFNARIAHERKYVESFKSLYPTSTVVLVKADTSWLWTPQASREALLDPVADVLYAAKDAEGARFRGVLLHAMSNGGGMQLLVLSKLLAKRPHTSARGLDPVALVLDSVPDSNGLRCMVTVFTQTVKSPLKKVIAIPILAFFYSLFHISYGGPPVLVDLRRRLNSPELVPLSRHVDSQSTSAPVHRDSEKKPPYSGAKTLSPAVPVDDRIPRIPRLYLASPADKMTRFAQVQAHMEEAKRAGFDVRAEVFEDSGHVAHARVDPARYWAAINKLWRHASSRPVAARL